jgi:hypothetical protein
MTNRAAKKLVTLLAVAMTAGFVLPAFADEDHHDHDRDHRHGHPRPYVTYQQGYVYAPPPVYYAPPPPPPIAPSLNIVVPLRIR